MKFCIFGLQRSGTSFFESLLKLNFKCDVANANNWKHELKRVHVDHKIYNTYKNPYTWIESVIFRDPADLLVTSPHLIDAGYNIGHDKVNLIALSKLYNDYVLSWYDKSTFVRYEDLLDETKRNFFLESVPFERISNDWLIPEAGSLFMSEGFNNNIIPYYLDEKPTKLSEYEINIINDNISIDIFNALGYIKL